MGKSGSKTVNSSSKEESKDGSSGADSESEGSFDFNAPSQRPDVAGKKAFDPHSMGDDDKVRKIWYIIYSQFNRI